MNVADVCLNMFVAMLCGLAAFYVEDLDGNAVSYTCFILITAMVVVLMLVVAYSVYHKARANMRRFDFFICHHKVGAVGLARLLKLLLLDGANVDSPETRIRR